MSNLVRDLAERLRHHLSQLCDEKNCVTPDHLTTRALLERAYRWLGAEADDPAGA